MANSAYREFNFGLGEVIDAVRDQARRFAQERIAPRANEIDRSNVFPRDLWPELGELGLLGMTVSPDYGGAGLGYLAHTDRDGGDLARLGRRGLELRRAFEPVREPVGPERERGAEAASYLPKLISGEHVGALAMSEPGAGSDVVSMQLKAIRHGDRYVLDGRKMWITNGPEADVLVVYAKTNPTARQRAASAPSSSRRASRVSRRRKSSTSSACAARAPASWCSTAAKCRRKTCSARRIRASAC